MTSATRNPPSCSHPGGRHRAGSDRGREKVFEAAGAPIQWIKHQAGLAALEQGQPLLSDETLRPFSGTAWR